MDGPIEPQSHDSNLCLQCRQAGPVVDEYSIYRAGIFGIVQEPEQTERTPLCLPLSGGACGGQVVMLLLIHASIEPFPVLFFFCFFLSLYFTTVLLVQYL